MIRDMQIRAVAFAAAAIVASNAYAACVPPAHETLVRGRFVRCESALLHTEAAGGDPALLQRVYADEVGAEEQLRFGIVVIHVNSQVRIDPWTPDRGSPVFQGEPHEVDEYVRYWLSGPAAISACSNVQAGASIDFLITQPCCDTFPAIGPCLIQMNYAQPASEVLRSALAGLLDQ